MLTQARDTRSRICWRFGAFVLLVLVLLGLPLGSSFQVVRQGCRTSGFAIEYKRQYTDRQRIKLGTSSESGRFQPYFTYGNGNRTNHHGPNESSTPAQQPQQQQPSSSSQRFTYGNMDPPTETRTTSNDSKQETPPRMDPLSSAASNNTSTTPTPKTSSPLFVHHAALKTRNLTTAIQFYSLLGYEETCRFRAGPARAVWLEIPTSQCRLEVIEVPSYMLGEGEFFGSNQRRRAFDLMEHPAMLGYNHVALDVTEQVKKGKNGTLAGWIANLNDVSKERFDKSLRVALQPLQQIIGSSVYEMAFLYDADGCLVELLHFQKTLPQEMESGWAPWDGQGFMR